MTPDGRHFYEGRRVVQAHGFWWLLDDRQLIDKSLQRPCGWEPDTTAALRRLVQPGMTVYDIGANIGVYTVLMGGMVGESGRVVAFEAMAEAARLAQAHVVLNGLEWRTTVLTQALSDASGKREMMFNYSWAGDAVDQPRVLVDFARLDDSVAAGLPAPDVMKIDVDGYEAKLLRGAEHVLRQHRPVLVLEVCDYTLRHAAGRGPARRGESAEYGDEVRALWSMLEGWGYRFLDERSGTALTMEGVLSSTDLSRYSINAVVVPTQGPEAES